MAVLAVQTTSRAGIAAPLAAAAAGGDEVPNDGRTVVEIRNANTTTARTVTVVTPQVVDTLAVADRTVSVPANSRVLAGPFPAATYNNPANGRLTMTYDSAADLTVGAFRAGA